MYYLIIIIIGKYNMKYFSVVTRSLIKKNIYKQPIKQSLIFQNNEKNRRLEILAIGGF